MKLDFNLFVVDDDPDDLGNAIGILGDYLYTKGFALNTEFSDDVSEKGVQDLAQTQGRNFDLVLVDYNLGQDDWNGAAAARQLRQVLRYVDMVFYSSAPVSVLLRHLAEHEVSGVFAEERMRLGDALIGVADTIIGKAVDINHMRGIAMAEVAEMDVLMEQTLVQVFQSGKGTIVDAKERTIEKLREAATNVPIRLENRFRKSGLIGVVEDSLLFSSFDKYRAIRRLINCLPETEKPLNAIDVLDTYEEDIIANRNILAHVKEEFTEDGKTILRPIRPGRGETVINDDWMSNFRRKLQEHMSALTTVCEALCKNFDLADLAQGSHGHEP